MNAKPCRISNTSHRRVAFTVIELLVVIVVLALLATMLLPALAGARQNSAAFQCMNNLRQLQVAWMAYSADNNDAICPNANIFHDPTAPNWVYGSMFSSLDQTNAALIQQGLLWPYVKSLAVYKCPADLKTSSNGTPTLRSFSMNAFMNPLSAEAGYGRIFRKQSDIKGAMNPSKCWVLIDESPATLNDGWFVCEFLPSTSWIDFPATYHNKGCGLSFADGHAEIKRWRDRYVLSNMTPGNRVPADPTVPPVPCGDLRWLQQRTTVSH